MEDQLELVDARGRSCPEPVLMTKRKLEAMRTGRLVVRVDSSAARDNVTRLATRLGWEVRVTSEGGEFRLQISKGQG